MRYGSALVLIGLAQISLAGQAGVFAWILCWSGLSWLTVGIAYFFGGQGIFGKQRDGRLNLLNAFLLLPYLLITWTIWHLQRVSIRDTVAHEIVPGIWLGRRCSVGKLPVGVAKIVDVTAEFAEHRTTIAGREYCSIPILDGAIPRSDDFERAIRTIAVSDVPTYVHCAKGYGRSAMVVIGVLLVRRIANSLEEAEELVRTNRPGIKLNREQRLFLDRWSRGHLQKESMS